MKRQRLTQHEALTRAFRDLKPGPNTDKAKVLESLRIYILLSQIYQLQCEAKLQSLSYYQLLMRQTTVTHQRLALLSLKLTETELYTALTKAHDPSFMSELYSVCSDTEKLEGQLHKKIITLLNLIGFWDAELVALISNKEQGTTYFEYACNLAIYSLFFLKQQPLINMGLQFTEFTANYFKHHAAQQAVRLGAIICSAGYFYHYGIISPALLLLFVYAAGQVVKAQRNIEIILPEAAIKQNTYIELKGLKLPILTETWLLRLGSLAFSCSIALILFEPIYILYGVGGIIGSMTANGIARLVTQLFECYKQKTINPASKLCIELVIASLGLYLGKSIISNYYFERHVREEVPMYFRPALDYQGCQPETFSEAAIGDFTFPDFNEAIWPYLLRRRETVTVMQYVEVGTKALLRCPFTEEEPAAQLVEELSKVSDCEVFINRVTSNIYVDVMAYCRQGRGVKLLQQLCQATYVSGAEIRFFKMPVIYGVTKHIHLDTTVEASFTRTLVAAANSTLSATATHS